MRRHVRAGDCDGYSLVELMFVMLVLAVLVAIAVASYVAAAASSRRVACLQNQRVLASALVAYTIDHHGIQAPDLAAVQPRTNWIQGYGRCVSTGAELIYDADSGDITCPTPGHEMPGR
jgi:prepilin-type N-terminal cleavage/methylation domain-containing protein